MKALRIAGFGKSELAFDMFDLPRQAADAKRTRKLEAIYHRGQELAWEGKDVLAELIEKHGGVHATPEVQGALAHIFGVILWGELAAWKISAQLADRLVPLEAKMAATSQAHDEARHFYVMYDYLSALGKVPKELDASSRALLDMVLNTDDLLSKLMGMQLMVESMALTLFQAVREARPEPVLADLLKYYEKDEARHVGLGVQHLPAMLRETGLWKGAKAFTFQLRLTFWSIASLKALEKDLAVLGIDARQVLQLGKAKQLAAVEQLWEQMGMSRPRSNALVSAAIESACELVFPRQGPSQSYWSRCKQARAVWKAGGFEFAPTTLDDPPEAISRGS